MKSKIRNIKVRDQILLVTLPPVFALLFAVGLIYTSFRSALSTERAATQTKDNVLRSDSFIRQASEGSTALRRYLFTQQRDALSDYYQSVNAARADLLALHDQESDNTRGAWAIVQIRLSFEDMQKDWAERLIDRVNQGAPFDVASTIADGQQRLIELRAQVLKLQGDDARENQRKLRGAEIALRHILIAGVTAAILLGALLIYLTMIVTGEILRPVEHLIEASAQVAQGNLSPQLPHPAGNEFGVLSQTFAQMTNALQRERAELASLNRFYEAVGQARSEAEVYDQILFSIRERFQATQIFIFEFKPAEDVLEVVASLLPVDKARVGSPAVSDRPDCEAIRAGRPHVINDLRLESGCPSGFELPTEGSYYCGPLIAGDFVVGAVRVQGPRNMWPPERQRLLESYLAGAASALSNLRLLNRMQQQVNLDPLTGLYNRRFLEDYARKIFAIADRRQQPASVLMLDLDHYKSFNDVYGHDMGDRILRQFAQTINAAMRETNLAARYGGEEFVVILPDTDIVSASRVAERIRKAVEAMVIPSDTEKPLPRITVSVGAASFPTHGFTPEEVIHASDVALYESKRAGRNRVTMAESKLNEPIDEPEVERVEQV